MRTLLFLALFVTGVARAENLLPDPSFEKAKERDRWGHVFSDWDGWIFEAPARFEVGQVAHSGSNSCAMVGETGTKIRMFSHQISVTPGRYQVTAFFRMTDVKSELNGDWGGQDFSVEADGKWFSSHHWFYRQGDKLVKADGKLDAGDHGWRQLTYVFDVPPSTNPIPARVQFGLTGEGRVWLDDVTLERVDNSVELTSWPIVGAEEKPISPPGPLGENRVRCSDCACWNDPAWGHCYRCGAPLETVQKFTSPAVQSFGERRLLAKGYTDIPSPADWSEHDYLRFDVTNAQSVPVVLDLEIRDAETRDYWTRVNTSRLVPPGTHTISFPTRHYVGEKARPGRMLIRNRITRFVINVGDHGPVTLDNFRLERLDASAVQFPELLAFDFGPANALVLEGFQHGNTAGYTAGRGYGWMNAHFWGHSVPNALQTDPTQESLCPESGSFRMDVPNGRYRVWMIIDSPGGYWGEVQTFHQREVRANGVPVITETMDLASFTQRYFRNANREDRPGIDTYAEYVRPMCPPKQFTVDVANGKLELEFHGANRAISLAGLVVFPEAKSAEGERFLAWTDQRRREQFEESYRLMAPPPVGAAAPTDGYRLFQRHFMDPVGPLDGPRDGEELGAQPLTVSVARSEEMPLTFSLQPGSELGPVTLEMSTFKSKKGVVLDAATLTPGWIDYRITRVTSDGTVYAIQPRYWRELPAPAAKVTRTFWIRVHAPTNAVAGDYSGTVTVKPQAAPARSVPVTVHVRPFALAEIDDVAAGPWSCSIDLPWFNDDPATKAWNARLFGECLDALRAGGCTSFSMAPPLEVKAEHGQITLKTDAADQQMALVRAKGFQKLIGIYGTRYLGYDLYQYPTDDQVRAAGFTNALAYAQALWQAIDAHAVAKDWPPLAWNLCDEPLGDAIAAATRVAQLHRAVATGLQRTTFMGATSFAGNDTNNPHYALAKALPLPSLNIHDDASLALLRAAGNPISFYNGGNRWTYGRYMKALVRQYQLALRLTWHFNAAAGDPYYALDCREDDYCWFNSDAAGNLVPSLSYLREILPGLNDYRYLQTLEKLIAAKRTEAAGMNSIFGQRAKLETAITNAQTKLDALLALTAGKDRDIGELRIRDRHFADYEADRAQISDAITALLKP